MKIVSDHKKTKVTLSNMDILEITIENEMHTKMVVKCLGNTLHIEESFGTLNDKEEEEKAIQAMDAYLKKQEKIEETRELKK